MWLSKGTELRVSVLVTGAAWWPFFLMALIDVEVWLRSLSVPHVISRSLVVALRQTFWWCGPTSTLPSPR